MQVSLLTCKLSLWGNIFDPENEFAAVLKSARLNMMLDICVSLQTDKMTSDICVSDI